MARDDIGDETPLQPSVQAAPGLSSESAPGLSSEVRALLDEFFRTPPRTPPRVETQESMDALATLENLEGLSFTDVINKDLYGSFKTALNVLISANYFDPQYVKAIEDHLATTDACVVIHKHALKRLDESCEKDEHVKNVVKEQASRVAQLAKLEQSFNKDTLELAELERRAELEGPTELEGRIQSIRTRMDVTADTIEWELKDHEVELGIYYAHNQGIQYFSDMKDVLEKALKDGEAEWSTWSKLKLALRRPYS